MRMDEWRRMRTQGKEFFGGRRCRDCLSLFSVHLFRWFFLNRMYAGFHGLRAVLKRHPCRIGLKWASLPISPLLSAFC